MEKSDDKNKKIKFFEELASGKIPMLGDSDKKNKIELTEAPWHKPPEGATIH